MVLIREVVKQAIDAGYLSLEAENEMQHIFSSSKCDLEDLNAFMSLQLAAMAGRVRQESLELISLPNIYGKN
ncbi:MAG: hypothetical protein JGK24_26505 [Microcoleus sp. PH2017_29_MFU_D_A]|uniref:hypothetical protein n=1 Tax=unclassified Microcoleus TaxID=2642155 RepID=UPI001E059BD7|nr:MULTISPECIES: hypothetical protein [unclassified Microcoleus]MCC3419442.1 hypothetical protein [Microcoleus sp. PH2017_07_MST_O_A]MCC3468693.1 hypothetical protein [Microcoleus sp. PH2017_06_SFM_O_A]MCC3510633.1 hypothetical protein [Microcoleus sp. PH2017_17_BER_D_A]TAE57028.1 MAG: hypothetical protein EAZ88_02850 [Oscillatoriales cyanobacterium]MCC3427152.1 hypothetical protein [Microcoleus sp. PH2017_01_SCD_O_A]